MVCFYKRLPKFDYFAPKDMGEALNLLAEGPEGRLMVYAGGTDVIPKLKHRMITIPDVLVDLKNIPDLNYIEYDETNGLRIGALASIYSVAHSPIVKEKFAILSQAAGSIASTQVQNRGTIVGNICNAVPSADSGPALLALEAKLLCVSNKGQRSVKISDFFSGPNKTALNGGELVKEVQIPNMLKNCNGLYIKLSPRSKMDLAVVGVATVVKVENGVFRDVRIGLGAVAPTPIRAKGSEDMLNGEKVSEVIIERASKQASEESEPIDDHRASAKYRKMMVEVLVKRAIHQTLSD